MATLAKLVRYQDYCKTVKLDRFTAVVRLVMSDLFTSDDEIVKAKKLFFGKHVFTAADLPKIRESEEYRRVLQDVQDKVELLTTEGGMDRLAELFEDANAQEMFRLAHFSGSARDRKAALEEFTSRRSAKKGRENSGKEMVLPERFIEQLTAGVAALASVIKDQQAEISGARLNVPRLVGEGRTSE